MMEVSLKKNTRAYNCNVLKETPVADEEANIL